MDISSFSDENFDTKGWINKILSAPVAQEKEENHLMFLVMKLQLYVQEINNALEETSQQVLTLMPKIARDTKNLQLEAVTLKEKMVTVHREIVKIEEDTGNSMSSIEKLDSIKEKLLEAKQGLHESDNWMVLVNDLEEVFDSKNVEAISAKLLSMQQSLKLLINVGDYEERKLQLDGLKNRLEAIVSPAIVLAFTTNQSEQAAFYANIFDSIGRTGQLLKYYHKCQKDVLLKKWRNQLELEQDEGAVQWIHNYFDILISNWHNQYKWFNKVFPNESAAETLIDIYVDVLVDMEPSFKECMDTALKEISDKLQFLQEIKDVIKQFANNILNIIQNLVNPDKYFPLMKAIYSPLVIYFSKYSSYESAHLTEKLTAMSCMKEELSETIQALGLSIPALIDLAVEAKKRCREITEDCGHCGLLVALRSFFVGYANQFRVALRQIDRSKGKHEDWNTFQLCLSLLQNAGEVLNNLQIYEKDLTKDIIDLNRGDMEFKNLLLDEEQRKEFESLVKCVTEGTQLSLLDHIVGEFTKLCSDIHHTTYQVVSAPIFVQLDVVQNGKIWNQFTDSSLSDLPEYSLSPQEYITQIGQYLMTLPQHLEPFLFRENPSLNCALKAADAEYSNSDEEGEGAMANIFLSIVARGTCQGYSDRILSIFELNQPASRQLAHDINYLGNVLEDLNLLLTENLNQLMALLRLPSDQYQSQSTGYSARYVAAVRQMRHITSSG
ncbi:PREDICTED: conserved oligomeric Golgi complex subunit 7 [Nicrophorus vespilloides]|uniref:Conserved oligomeric Golgi complex subunit 7 n=1 Tax=Nicrophorus vespilloides TaxID=110193 RepID=A0ABM1N9B3_NICVS|nr:PREDICTED: conserved oligomeric Golgi complex subunit 7 [Nicrophorus vespilloides]